MKSSLWTRLTDWYEAAPRWQVETAAFCAGLVVGVILCWLT